MPRRAGSTASAISPTVATVASVTDPGPLDEEQAPAAAAPSRKRSSGKTKQPAVNVEALTEISRVVIGAASYLIGLAVAAPDMVLADALSMTREECNSIAEPTGRILSGMSLVKRYAHAINNGNDYVLLVGGLWNYGERIATVYFERRPVRARNRQVPESAPVASSGAPAASNGHQPTYSGATGPGGIPAHLLAG